MSAACHACLRSSRYSPRQVNSLICPAKSREAFEDSVGVPRHMPASNRNAPVTTSPATIRNQPSDAEYGTIKYGGLPVAQMNQPAAPASVPVCKFVSIENPGLAAYLG